VLPTLPKFQIAKNQLMGFLEIRCR